MEPEDIEKLPESVREWDEVKNSKDLNVFWDQMSNLRSKIGTGLYKPGEDAGSEDWGKFLNKAVDLSSGKLIPAPNPEDQEQTEALYRALGKPTDPKEYEFAEIEGAELPDERKEFIRKIAHETGLTKNQLKKLDAAVRGKDFELLQAQKLEFDNGLKDLSREWGLVTEERTHLAKKIAKTFFPQFGEDPILNAEEIKSFYSLAKQLGNNTQEFRQQGNAGNDVMSPQEAADKINEIRSNPKHAYYDRNSHAHEAAKTRMRELYKIKNNISN